MYGKNRIGGYTEEELITKVESLVDAYVTAEQSKVVVDVLTKLHRSKSITDSEYSRSLHAVLDANGFDVK